MYRSSGDADNNESTQNSQHERDNLSRNKSPIYQSVVETALRLQCLICKKKRLANCNMSKRFRMDISNEREYILENMGNTFSNHSTICFHAVFIVLKLL